jgi:hypothetical protein
MMMKNRNFCQRNKKSEGRLLIGDTRWRTREEAVAAAAGPKRREPMAPGARQIRKAEAARIAPEAKCSSPAEVLALQGRRLFRTSDLAAGARQ